MIVGHGASMAGAGTDRIDAILLDLTYTVPTFRGETTAAVTGNCLAATCTGGSAGQCALLSTGGGYPCRFYLEAPPTRPPRRWTSP